FRQNDALSLSAVTPPVKGGVQGRTPHWRPPAAHRSGPHLWERPAQPKRESVGTGFFSRENAMFRKPHHVISASRGSSAQSSLSGSPRRNRRAATERAAHMAIESLEPRQLFSAHFDAAHALVGIYGSNNNDDIRVT